jgi:hypothetical protein
VWSKANPEKKTALDKAWHEANREKVAARGKVWQDANPEKVLASKWRYILGPDAPPELIAARVMWALVRRELRK